ncbi:MAG: AAA family ATPase [Thermoleophilia bacterium]
MIRLLSSLTLENFKAFGRRTTVPLAPITVLVGENSAGKSSIVQSLLFLKQTLAHTQTGREQLLPRGSLVDIGSIRELLFGHDCERTCEIAPLLAYAEGISFSLDFDGDEPKINLPLPPGFATSFSYPLGTERRGLGVRFGCSPSDGNSALETLSPRRGSEGPW